ncbi:hypothetical protein CLOL250_00359 [Clostridium sp. L2-50]|nr:hypothetical protein CLOL250_00359 [Clostridium sp. L2-50]
MCEDFVNYLISISTLKRKSQTGAHRPGSFFYIIISYL